MITMNLLRQSDDAWITEIVRRIVDTYKPQKIILFGSRGRGDDEYYSDVDLLVIMSFKGSKRNMAIEIGVTLHDIPLSKDIFVTTPEDFEWRKSVPGTIERPAALEGKILYART